MKSGPRRTAIRAIGRLERPELIALVAPSLNDGVGIRAEAANALAQLARTPDAVAQVQKLLIDRAAVDANLNTWESWGEIAAALGRLPYETPALAAEAEAVLDPGTAVAGFDERNRRGRDRRRDARARIAGAHRPRPQAAAAWRPHVGSAAVGGHGAAAAGRSALGR